MKPSLLIASGLAAWLLAGQSFQPAAAQSFPLTARQQQFAPSSSSNRTYLLTNPQDAILSGDSVRRDFDVHIARPQRSRVLLGYHISEHVVPEESQLAVWVNDTELLADVLPTPQEDGSGSLSVDVPADALREGWNTISLRASFATDNLCRAPGDPDMELRPQSTLLESAGSSKSGSISPGNDGVLDITIYEPDLTDHDAMERALRTAQDLGLRFPAHVGLLTVTDQSSGLRDSDLVIAASGVAVDHPHVMTPEELTEEIAIRPSAAERTPTLLEPGESYQLTELGLRTFTTGRNHHHFVSSFTLPDDFYGRHITDMRLKVRGASSAPPTLRPRLEVLVNGVRASGVLMPTEHQGNHVAWMADIMLNEAIPGRNQLDFVFFTPEDVATPCVPGDPAPPPDAFALNESSTLELNNFASAAMPSLRKTLTGTGGAIRLSLSDDTAEKYTAVARMLAYLATDMNETRPVELYASGRVPNGGLVVADLGSLNSTVVQAFDLTPERLRSLTPPDAQMQVDPALILHEDPWTKTLGNWVKDMGFEGDTTTAPSPGDSVFATSAFEGTASRTLLLGSDGTALALAAQQLTESTINVWKSTQFVMADDAKLRSASDARLARPERKSFGNMRLMAASWMSERPWVYAAIVMLAAILVGIFTRLQLVNTRNDI